LLAIGYVYKLGRKDFCGVRVPKQAALLTSHRTNTSIYPLRHKQYLEVMASSLATTTHLVHFPNVVYSDASDLNTLNVTLLRPTAVPNDPNSFFIIYIHGGAWRDPEIAASSFLASEKKLLDIATPLGKDRISGIASINYRLSPYPSHATSPSSPHDPARNASHPDHINDVLVAILYLQEEYAFGNRYILIGHSCGATLAFQVAMKRFWGSQYDPTSALELNVEPPMAVIGVSGIYDIPGLVDSNAEISAYRDLVVNAMGSDRKVWEDASPTNGDYENGWEEAKLAVLLHSEADELVAMDQPNAMFEALGKQGFSETAGDEKVRKFVKVKGWEHDAIWKDGKALADVILDTIADLTG
jgi:kynurenine formamidase